MLTREEQYQEYLQLFNQLNAIKDRKPIPFDSNFEFELEELRWVKEDSSQ